jgi:hypothetical protein
MSQTPSTTAIKMAIYTFAEPGQVVELRALNTPRDATVSGYFDDPETLAQAAAGWSGRAPAVYFTLNPVNPALLARANNRLMNRAKSTTSDGDIVRRRWLFVDFDPKRPAGISATDAEHEAALDRARQCRNWLSSMGWPSPVRADSSNGAHLLYPIDLPNEPASAELVKRCLQALDFQFSDTSVEVDQTTYNAARICKLYGTLSCKGDSTRDRPHRLSQLLDVPDPLVRVPHDVLEALAAQVPETPATPAGTGNGRKGGGDFDLPAWIAAHSLPVRFRAPWGNGGRKWILSPCPWNPDHDTGGYIVQLANGVPAAGCHHHSCRDKKWRDLWALYEPEYGQRAKPSGNGKTTDPPPADNVPLGPATTCLAGIRPEPVRWLIEGYVPLGKLGLLAGDGGHGKTTWTLTMAADVSRGWPCLGLDYQAPPQPTSF